MTKRTDKQLEADQQAYRLEAAAVVDALDARGRTQLLAVLSDRCPAAVLAGQALVSERRDRDPVAPGRALRLVIPEPQDPIDSRL